VWDGGASARAEAFAVTVGGVDGDTDIATLAALLADPGRARILLALGDGRALAASVLADEAGVAAATASEHLAKLLGAGLLTVESHGRHRYYRLSGPDVGELLEALARFAPAAPVRSLRQGTRAQAVRSGRTCYDHLAGRLGTALMSALLEQGALTGGDGDFRPDVDRLSSPGAGIEYRLTDRGATLFTDLGIDVETLRRRPRPLIRYCVDWSEQRHHLAGALGAALAQRLFDLGWIRRAAHSRAVGVTDAGAAGLHARFGLAVDDLAGGRRSPERTRVA
jgi:DNA-binding transcriptional ArsR family regulator